MTEIGLFPLGLVLLPTEHVPLHIFEPRYRELIDECIEHDVEFGLVYTGGEELCEVGTRAAVVTVLERFPDGRLNVVIEGRDRFRIATETAGRSFRTAAVEPVEDDGERADPATVARALALYERLLELAGAEAETPDAADPQLSFAIAGRFELAVEPKLELLELTSEPARLARVCEILDLAVKGIERQQAIGELAQTNGKGH
jgi:Lon protease-like protein